MNNSKAAGLTRRAVFEQRQRRRSIVIATTSTLLVLVALVVFVPMTPGWEKVQKSFFNTAVLVKTFPKLI
jgi:polar amino acid transport system permease protein